MSQTYEGLINRSAATFFIAATTVDDEITHELIGQSFKCLASAIALRGGTITDDAGKQYFRLPVFRAALNLVHDAVCRLAAMRVLPIDADDLVEIFEDISRKMPAVTHH